MTGRQSLITFCLESVGLALAIALVGGVVGARRPFRQRPIAGAVLAVIVILIALRSADAVVSQLKGTYQAPFSARAAADYCLAQDSAQARVPFVEWLRHRIPPHGRYVVALTGEPDIWCLTLALLPRLPVLGAQRAGWVIAMGVIPADVQARIDRRDPTVAVFGPDLAVARGVR